MDKHKVGTDKKRVSTYLSADFKKAIEAYADQRSITVSVAISELIEKVIINNGRIIPLNDEIWDHLESIALSERRTPEQQVGRIVEKALFKKEGSEP